MPNLNAFQDIGYVSLKDEQKINCYATYLLPEGNICISCPQATLVNTM